MTSPTILSSPFLTIPIVNDLLHTTPLSDHTLRSSLLSSKLYLLAQEIGNEIETCFTRLQLAELLLEIGKWKEAEYELGLVLGSKVIKGTRGGQENKLKEENSVREIRLMALRSMEDVNERLGRGGRARVWREQRMKLEGGG